MLGDILREEREKQNLTIKDVEQETSIRGLYISSIEKGEYDALPGEVYLKGFIKSYANYLKLDANAILDKYYEEKAISSDVADMQPEAKIINNDPVKEYEKSRKTTDNYLRDDFKERVEKSRRTQKIIMGAVTAVIVLGGAYFAFSSDDVKEQETTSQTKSAQTMAAKTEKVETPASVPEKKYDDVEIVANFSDKCWTKVVVDDRTVFEGTSKSGESLSWKGKNKIIITAGNAGAIELVYNGKNIGVIGATGDVVTKNFTKDQEETVK